MPPHLSSTICLLLTLSFCTNSAAKPQDDPKPQIQLFTGAYFQPLPHVIPYQVSIPLIYTLPLDSNFPTPTYNYTTNFCNATNNDTFKYCSIQQNLATLGQRITTQLEAEKLEFKQLDIRTKRSLTFVGTFFHWCCDIATDNQIHDLVDNEKDITDHTNNLIDMVSTEHQDLLVTTKNLNNFTHSVEDLDEKIHSSLKILQKEIEALDGAVGPNILTYIYSLTQQTSTHVYLNYYFDNLRTIKNKCYLHLLPESLISQTTLREDLQKLSKASNKKNLTLAIDPTTHLHLYYNLPITNCKIFPNNILIKLQIPLRSHEPSYKVFQNIPVPLHWEDKLCYLTRSKATIIKTQHFTQVIHEEDAQCNPTTSPLCLLPRETTTTDPTLRCIRDIIQGTNLSTLRNNCEFHCTPASSAPSITRILPNKFLLTNIFTDIKLTCPNQRTTTLPQNHSGTLEILLPCPCSVHTNTSTLIAPLALCDKEDVPDFKLTHLLPISWTKFSTLTIFPLDSNVRHQFTSIEEILNDNWTLSTPTYYVHNVQRQDTLKHIHLKHDEDSLFNNTTLLMYIFLAWSAILSILLLITMYCLHMQHIQLKYLRPQTLTRDYPMQQTTTT